MSGHNYPEIDDSRIFLAEKQFLKSHSPLGLARPAGARSPLRYYGHRFVETPIKGPAGGRHRGPNPLWNAYGVAKQRLIVAIVWFFRLWNGPSNCSYPG